METRDLLFEIQTEELPPKSLNKLRQQLVRSVADELNKLNFAFAEVQGFATPRRLAVLVSALTDQQPDQKVERKGPAVAAAWDADGNPTKALQGFARSCGIEDLSQLEQEETPKGTWLVYRSVEQGKNIRTVISDVFTKALAALPIEKRMRWGASRSEFVRPVHHVILMYGSEILDATFFGLKSSNITTGHRFMSTGDITISNPNDYIKALQDHHVIADFEARQNIISQQLADIEQRENARIVIDPALLEEVTALVEWPVALMGSFDETFLSVPEEALISAMKSHQRYFHMIDDSGKLLPRFVTISNIESNNPTAVIQGNERVISPRLTDAGFFFNQDQKTSLDDHLARLEKVVFQAELGTYREKAGRISELAAFIAGQMGADQNDARRAGLLCKADLVTDMVGEFPELQGLMGGYYATAGGEKADVATAIAEHYLPGFSGDVLPSNAIGQAVAMADKLDTLVGLFGINQPPTGSRDPFALRRQTLGVIRICIEKGLNIDILEVLQKAGELYQKDFDVTPVFDYLLDRMANWYQDQQLPADVFLAVRGGQENVTNLSSFNQRVRSIQAFRSQPQAESLIGANKRLANILRKTDKLSGEADASLFESEAESALFASLEVTANLLAKADNYESRLQILADLQPIIDRYFEDVMVMADDDRIRTNRLLTLKAVQSLFLTVADLSELQ
ncbi:MAG: glycine--tRNA ligase subunit beta [Pseudomonadales bacterium]|nr:glycine--tRNA ligase subunit beta [Pseudomonadales bacterium]